MIPWMKHGTRFDASEVVTSDTFTTRFRYPLGEESTSAVEEGIETLKRCAPFVVVFNRQFRRIVVESPQETTSFEVIERAPLEKVGLQTVTVGVSEHGSVKERRYLLAEGEASISDRSCGASRRWVGLLATRGHSEALPGISLDRDRDVQLSCGHK